LNPLDLSMSQWRRGTVHNWRGALEKLDKYRWSSHLDYLGEKNFPSILDQDLVEASVGKRAMYEKQLRELGLHLRKKA